MLEPETKQLVRSLWQRFWEGGITDTLRIVEQISYLIFMKRLELLDSLHLQRAEAGGEKYTSVYARKDDKGKNYSDCKWSAWNHMNAEDMRKHILDRVFPFIKDLHEGEDTLFAQTMADASFQIEKASLLQEAVSIIDKLDISAHRPDMQGDIFEELLSELQVSGKNGQFRTPRHIIRMMVQLIDPKIGETICDPACGTGGFLINAYEHILKNNTSEKFIKYDEKGEAHNFVGDKIVKPEHWQILRTRMFYGSDFDRTMLRIGTMNMILHGIKHPNIQRIDSLSKRFDQTKLYDIIMANPPFAGSIDKGDVNENFTTDTKKTELLFVELFYNILENGGRAAVIVPTGVLFGSSKAHLTIRKLLLEKCQLDAIIYLPSGVFKPYSGVSTAVLIFTKGGHTEKVWLYEMQNDGYSLDDKREPTDKNDIPDILKKFAKREQSPQSISVTLDMIKENDYNLNVKRYIDNSEPEEEIDIQKTVDELKKLEKERETLEKQVNKDLQELGFKV